MKFPRPAGTRFAYTDNTLDQKQWKLGEDLAAIYGNPVSATLAPLYAGAGLGYVMYNVRSSKTQLLKLYRSDDSSNHEVLMIDVCFRMKSHQQAVAPHPQTKLMQKVIPA